MGTVGGQKVTGSWARRSGREESADQGVRNLQASHTAASALLTACLPGPGRGQNTRLGVRSF